MNDLISSFAVLNKKRDEKKILKEVTTSFNVFQSNHIEFTKVVDRPDDYYFEKDEITYIIHLKNVGQKNIKGFCLKDDAPVTIDPLDSGYYEIISPVGDVSFLDDYVVIENIDLEPGDDVEITITGLVKEQKSVELSEEEISF